MIVNTVAQAKAQLPALIERVQSGQVVIIAKAGKPVAVLQRYPEHPKQRQPGVLRGQIRIAPDFDELPSDIAEAFGAVRR